MSLIMDKVHKTNGEIDTFERECKRLEREMSDK